MYVCIYAYIYIYVCMYVCMYVCIHVYMYVYVCICMYICCMYWCQIFSRIKVSGRFMVMVDVMVNVNVGVGGRVCQGYSNRTYHNQVDWLVSLLQLQQLQYFSKYIHRLNIQAQKPILPLNLFQ